MDNKRLISSKLIQEEFVVMFNNNYYKLQFNSYLELFLESDTTGSVSKLKISGLDPTKWSWKIVDDRNCYITHSSNFKFDFLIYPLSIANELRAKTSVEINQFSNLLFKLIVEGVSYFASGAMADMGVGEACRCAGSIGKARIKAHESVYINAFSSLHKDVTSFLGSNFLSIISDVFEGLSMVLPTTLKMSDIGNKEVYVTSILKTMPFTVPTIPVSELILLKTTPLIIHKIISCEVEEIISSLSKDDLLQVFEKCEEISEKYKLLYINHLLPLEVDSLYNPFTENAYNRGECLLISGSHGMMNPYIYPSNIGYSKAKSAVFGQFIGATRVVRTCITKIKKIQPLIKVFGFEFKQLNELELFIANGMKKFEEVFSDIIDFTERLNACRGTYTPYDSWSHYEELQYRWENPQYWWTDPGRPNPDVMIEDDLKRLKNMDNLNDKVIRPVPLNDLYRLRFNDVLRFLPTQIKNKDEFELINSVLTQAKHEESNNSIKMKKIENLMVRYNEIAFSQEKIGNELKELISYF